MADIPSPPLLGQKALVLGIANEYSIAFGCARAFRKLGAELAITYLNDKARPYVEPLAQELEAPIFLPLDVQQAGQLEAVFDRSARRGAGSTSPCTPSPSPPRKTCRAACSTAPRPASAWRWTCPATRSCAWPGWRRR